MRNIAIYVYDEVEVLDFARPFEVFATASRGFGRLNPDAPKPFRVFTVTAKSAPIAARGGLVVHPEFSFTDHPPIDVLLVPGGVMTGEVENPEVIAWVAARADSAELTASVCTGAFLLGKAGLLEAKNVTTHWEDVADLRAMLPNSRVLEEVRWIDEGRVITAAGISAGLDMSLHIVARLAGRDLALRTARQMEYEWRGGNQRPSGG